MKKNPKNNIQEDHFDPFISERDKRGNLKKLNTLENFSGTKF